MDLKLSPSDVGRCRPLYHMLMSWHENGVHIAGYFLGFPRNGPKMQSVYIFVVVRLKKKTC